MSVAPGDGARRHVLPEWLPERRARAEHASPRWWCPATCGETCEIDSRTACTRQGSQSSALRAPSLGPALYCGSGPPNMRG